MVRQYPVSFEFAGGVYEATCGARDTMSELVNGGVVNQQDFALLVPLANVAAMNPRPAERSKLAVFVDNDGIPCRVEDAADAGQAKVTCRVVRIGRALAGLTYTLTTEQKG